MTSIQRARLGRSFAIAMLAVVVSLAPATATRDAFAQTPAPTDTTGDPAAALFKQGNEAYAKKKWPEAYDAYKRAFELKPSYDVAANLGDVELLLGKSRDAAEHLEFSLRNWPAGNQQAKARTQARFNEARKNVGTLYIRANVEGAEISVNGKPVGKAPLPGPVFAGTGAISIEATHEDQRAKRTVAVAQGDEKTVELELAKSTHRAALAPTNGEPPPGTNASPANGAAPSSDTPSTASEHPKSSFMIIGASVAAVGLVAGLGFTLAANSKHSERDDKRNALSGPSPCAAGTPNKQECAEIADLDESGDRLRRFGIGGFVLFGVAGAATLAYWLWPREKTRAKTAITPAISDRSAGLFVSGAF